MAVNWTTFAEYLNVAPDSRENLQFYLDAAKSKARSAGVPDLQANAQYDLFLYALAAMYYDNRGMGFGDTGAAEDAAQRMINSFVLELRHATDDSEAVPDG